MPLQIVLLLIAAFAVFIVVPIALIFTAVEHFRHKASERKSGGGGISGFVGGAMLELDNFHRFADQKLQVAGYESLEELLGLWRANHPLAKESPHARATRAKSTTSAKPDDPKKSAVPYL